MQSSRRWWCIHLMLFQFLEWAILCDQQDNRARQPQALSRQKMHQPREYQSIKVTTEHTKSRSSTNNFFTFVLIDFSRSCLFIDFTIFGTSCFNNHLGLHTISNKWIEIAIFFFFFFSFLFFFFFFFSNN